MKVEQIYTGCLAQGAYYIESNGEVAIIDPLRESSPYIQKAEKEGAKIKYVFETHFHADFVSGHVSLANKTGAQIIFGPLAETAYSTYTAKDQEEFKLGDVTIKVLHTPGHTMESSCFLLLDEEGKEHSLFSGDTLFIGDVGRPDLAVKSVLTVQDLAKHLYHSLREKVMTLPDDVMIYPAHGAGSACGKNMSKETFDTLKNQKATNYALRSDMSEEEFVSEVTKGLSIPPQYFPKNVLLNKEGYDDIDQILKRGTSPLSVSKFEELANSLGALILDTRSPQEFKDNFIPNSINIGIDGNFAPWVGALIIDLKQPILIIAEAGREEEAVTRLSRVGYDNTVGYLEGGIEVWLKAKKETDTIASISAKELQEKLHAEANIYLLDVRKQSEFIAEHIDNKQVNNFPLDLINENFDALDRSKEYHIHCAGGYRSMITTSILKSRGFRVIDIAGGFKSIQETDINLSTYICPTTLN